MNQNQNDNENKSPAERRNRQIGIALLFIEIGITAYIALQATSGQPINPILPVLVVVLGVVIVVLTGGITLTRPGDDPAAADQDDTPTP